MKNYRLGFDLWGLVLFLVTMIPTVVWLAIPAPNDVLRVESATPVLDAIGFILQVLFVVIICFFIRKDNGRRSIVAPIVCIALYFFGWVLYYFGLTNWYVILLLTLPPCLAFIFYALGRCNVLALVPAVGFAVCHLIYACVNFIF